MQVWTNTTCAFPSGAKRSVPAPSPRSGEPGEEDRLPLGASCCSSDSELSCDSVGGWPSLPLSGTEIKRRLVDSGGLEGIKKSGIHFSRNCVLSHFSCVQLCNPWIVAPQALLSLGFSRQEYWSGLPCPPSGNLPDPGLNPHLLCRLHWQAGYLPLISPGKPGSGPGENLQF